MMKKAVLALTILTALITLPALAQMPVEVHPNQKQLLQSDDPTLAANKKLVYEFWRRIIQARNTSLAEEFMTETYIQHNPHIATGRKAFVELFSRSAPVAEKDHVENLVAIVAEGDLVTLAFRREEEHPQKPGTTYTTTWFDMFRVENGKVAEHWDPATL